MPDQVTAPMLSAKKVALKLPGDPGGLVMRAVGMLWEPGPCSLLNITFGPTIDIAILKQGQHPLLIYVTVRN